MMMVEIESLVGETLTNIDVDEGSRKRNQSILLTTKSGRTIRIYHIQDCCETVKIEDTQGNWHDLVGKVIVEATHDAVPNGDPPPKYPECWTRTTLTFKTDDATVINKWIGESNGYYSESVDLVEVSSNFNE